MVHFFPLCLIGVAIGGCMNQRISSEASSEVSSNTKEGQSVVLGLWGVRYQVKDVSHSIDFYTKQLGLKLDMQNLPAFGQVSIGNLKLILSGPGASGSRPMPDGRPQEPGGWNRIILQVKDLPARIEALKKAGLHFRNEMAVGPGGKQIQLEDPTAIRLSCSSRLASRTARANYLRICDAKLDFYRWPFSSGPCGLPGRNNHNR